MNVSHGNDSCQSTLQLWRQIQTIIRTGNEQDFERLCGKDRAPKVARVLLSQRLVNDSAASNKGRILPPPILPQQPFHRIFGTSVRDLDALQLSLFLRQESIAMALLDFIQKNSTKNQLGKFMNHPWGQQNTSLHLAAYLGMERLVQRLLEYGADPTIRNARQQRALDGCTNLACIQLLQPTHGEDLARTSLLLKKAVQRLGPMEQQLTNRRTSLSKPSLVFSSSTSSSSSLSSLEDPPPMLYSPIIDNGTPQDLDKSPCKKKSVRFSPETILLDCCVNGQVDELMALDHKVPSSLLHVALIHRQEEICKALVKLGVDVNATDPNGWTPLHYAAALKLWSMVDLLAQQPNINLCAKTNLGEKVYDCPKLWVDQRRCQRKYSIDTKLFINLFVKYT